MTQTVEGASRQGREALDTAMLRRADFSTVRRGFDPSQVGERLGAAADALDAARAEAERLHGLVADARAAAAEVESLRARGRSADERSSAQQGELNELRAALMAAVGARDGAVAEGDRLRAARPSEDELIAMVGDAAGSVLTAARASAEEVADRAAIAADALITAARSQAAAMVSRAEEETLVHRRASQERADAVLAEARQDADAMRRDAQAAARLTRDEIDHEGAEARRAADEESATVRREADLYAVEIRDGAERDARRIVAEAEVTAAAKVGGAEDFAAETREGADARLRESNLEMAALRERELATIGRMREVREALTQHLFATRSGLDEVIVQVAGDGAPALVVGEVVEQPGEVEAPKNQRLARAGRPRRTT